MVMLFFDSLTKICVLEVLISEIMGLFLNISRYSDVGRILGNSNILLNLLKLFLINCLSAEVFRPAIYSSGLCDAKIIMAKAT